MITKFEKYNESISSLLVGPTKEEVWSELMNGKLKGLIKSIPDSPEDFFNQIREGCIKNGNLYTKNNIELFRQNLWKRYLDVSYEYIWEIIGNVYNLTYDEIQSLIKKILITDNKWKRFIPYSYSFIYN